eukprot:15464423-Alexandrium_andersonii.AAC.1
MQRTSEGPQSAGRHRPEAELTKARPKKLSRGRAPIAPGAVAVVRGGRKRTSADAQSRFG